MPTDAAPRPIHIAPSVLPADFSKMGDELRALADAGVDRIHWDVMDGQFVPNMTFGPGMIAACRAAVDLPFEAHLMVNTPEVLLHEYIEAGCQLITIHAESTVHLHRCLSEINAGGSRAAVTIVPSTPISAIEHILDLVDMVLIMTVNPGFGGQAYIASMEPKVAELRRLILDRGLDIDIEVDGGIAPSTIADATTAGANVFVAGSALFRDPAGLAHAVADLRTRAEAAQHGAHAA
ncbi:ribulose-phosphate 3-epimerase [Aquihabitans sp. McL0605]|uniref:ribulose-phosphate 3-epimerase n=1 Tax=Aquihabitans sp. McL0605 TaxID=3415671 RepID=UPI003CF3D514